ncbi:outer membrane protein [Methylocella tundrae]|uniref:Putative OmpA-like transmembrane domain n=1 Tax=Methylocella tundrae TaxID=227605 RepID=A0A4U8Z7J7_METTU|nr:outer membrane beta-barrel protein [Methylocella tundrae]WPP02739.1 outer membrane beta-barrel protein [Methylocella tundrae]VFU17489.1 putative OmpA-like transmembrane domain [Methylocella tundrae]
MKTSVFTFALTFCAGATFLGSSMAAPLETSPVQPSADAKIVLAYSQLDEPPLAPHNQLKMAQLHKHKSKKHPRRHLARRAIKHKAPRLAHASAPLAQYPRPEISVPRRVFDGPYAGFEAGAQNASGAFRAPAFGSFPPIQPMRGASSSFGPGFWGFAGYNVPVGNVVAGLEGDAGVASPYGGLTGASGSLRARLGVTVSDGVMIYATSGVMIANHANLIQNSGALEAGWTGGGGVETFIAQGLSIRVEYLYGRGVDGHFDTNTIRSGVAVNF